MPDVSEEKVAKNRLHMDIRARISAEVERLTAAGATTRWVDTRWVDTDHHVVMADPEGNECCVA